MYVEFLHLLDCISTYLNCMLYWCRGFADGWRLSPERWRGPLWAPPCTNIYIWAEYFHVKLIMWKVSPSKFNSFFNCSFQIGLNTLMLLKIWVQYLGFHILGALGCEYILGILIINITYKCNLFSPCHKIMYWIRL